MRYEPPEIVMDMRMVNLSGTMPEKQHLDNLPNNRRAMEKECI
jgi:hypothetical protein